LIHRSLSDFAIHREAAILGEAESIPARTRALSQVQSFTPMSSNVSSRRRGQATLSRSPIWERHKSKAVRDAIRAAGAKHIFLPASSPDLNKIDPSADSGGLRQAEIKNAPTISGTQDMRHDKVIPR
jgi:hypothetical protein